MIDSGSGMDLNLKEDSSKDDLSLADKSPKYQPKTSKLSSQKPKSDYEQAIKEFESKKPEKKKGIFGFFKGPKKEKKPKKK